MTQDPHRLIRIALAGLGDIEEWRLGDPAKAAAKGYPRTFPAQVIDDWGLVYLDIVLEHETGDLVCHEVNGPNAVGTDALTGDSHLRARGEARQTVARLRERGLLPLGTRGDDHRALAGARLGTPVVTLHAHQHWKAFRTGGEFFPRVADYATALRGLLPGCEVELRSAAEPLGAEHVSVVMGDVPAVATAIERDPDSGRFTFRGRPVVFVGNPNVLWELIRTRKLARDAANTEAVDRRVFHAWRLLGTTHEKGLQQDLLTGTAMRPLRYFEASSRAEAIRKTRAMLARGSVVLKPNGASGGAGVHVTVPSMTDDEIGARVDTLVADCARKYGDNVEATLFPIRGFEFVRSTGYPMADGGHLWDLRIGVVFEPGKAHVFPVSLRLAPMPFDPATFHDDRDQWVSNVSGRTVTLLKSGMDDETLAAVGLTEARLDAAFQASVVWTMKAWDAAARGGGPRGAVHEDAAEADDPDFYPRKKFAV